MRTTDILVRLIIEVEEGFDLSPFISIANQLVSELCVDNDYADDRLESIERYLAAHFYTNFDPRLAAEKAGPVSVNYQNAVDLGFDSSFYGQTAMRLDTSGNLSSLNQKMKKGIKPRVGITWIGN